MATEHLGGDVPGGDPDTHYPALWNWLVYQMGVSSVVDIGCGDGHAIDHFERLGCRVWGYDGVERAHSRISQHDFTKGYADAWASHRDDFDLCWTCEFVEHVEERYMPYWLALLSEVKYVAMTHAVPGQGGYHHVNCRTSDYWQGVMAAVGFQLDTARTAEAREVALLDSPHYFPNTGMIFRRPDAA